MTSGWATAISPSAMLGANGMEKCSGCSFWVIYSQDTPVIRKKSAGTRAYSSLCCGRTQTVGPVNTFVRQPRNRHNKKAEISNGQVEGLRVLRSGRQANQRSMSFWIAFRSSLSHSEIYANEQGSSSIHTFSHRNGHWPSTSRQHGTMMMAETFTAPQRDTRNDRRK